MPQSPQSTPVEKKEASAARRLKRPLAVNPSRGSQPLVPIVGIGASAGGLEALDLFLRNEPPDCGLLFVIVQHLDPTQKSCMVELLQRATGMKVLQVKDRTSVQPACVYVIPPNKEMSILHGCLHLLDRGALHGVHLPIDRFFRSLADDRQDHSIGVILSGMGSDGTLGLRAIKEKGDWRMYLRDGFHERGTLG